MDFKERNAPGLTARPEGRRLRALTYLAPGIPLEFFERVTRRLEEALGCSIELASESRSSGPMHGDEDPFRSGEADLGFLCSPSYLYLRAQAEPSVELVPAGFVFDDPRYGGAPVYYSDVVVRADHPARSFGDLRGAAWGYNDECSLSGYFCALQKLSEIGCTADYFGLRVRTGSHHASIAALLSGDVDAAMIDSNVLALLHRDRPETYGRLRVLESWGPFPIQPIVIRAGLGASWAPRVAQALLELEPAAGGRLAHFGLARCAPIDDSAYELERRALCDLGEIPGYPSPPASQP